MSSVTLKAVLLIIGSVQLIASHHVATNKVVVQYFYESLCPHSVDRFLEEIVPTIEHLAPYVELHCLPYGNAETLEEAGGTVFECQHGPAECYGNTLHACAIDTLDIKTYQHIPYLACLMQKGSTRSAAIKCGSELNVNPEPILRCTEGSMGIYLEKIYGERTQKQKLSYVPLILVNGKEAKSSLMVEVCSVLKYVPQVCRVPKWNTENGGSNCQSHNDHQCRPNKRPDPVAPDSKPNVCKPAKEQPAKDQPVKVEKESIPIKVEVDKCNAAKPEPKPVPEPAQPPPPTPPSENKPPNKC